MISSYRLGDLLLVGLSPSEQNEILTEHPGSIGSKYILAKRRFPRMKRIDLITRIVIDHVNQNDHLLPNDIRQSTVIHLRLGDVVAGNQGHEKQKRPLPVQHIKAALENNADKKYVIGKCFFAKPSSTNYEECVRLSEEYMAQVLKELDAEHFNADNADIDLCCAVKSKLFVQGKGYFSQLISLIRDRLKLPSIKTLAVDPL